jgi:plastocyanin
MANHIEKKSIAARIYMIGITALIACLIFGISCKTSDTTGFSPTTSTTATNEVVMQNLAFEPATLKIRAETVVTWRNDDSMSHTVTARDGSFESSTMSHGGTFSFTFTQKGTFEYYCKIHPSMKGSIIVE